MNLVRHEDVRNEHSKGRGVRANNQHTKKERKEGKEEKRKNVLLWKHLEQLSSRPRDNPQPELLTQCTRET